MQENRRPRTLFAALSLSLSFDEPYRLSIFLSFPFDHHFHPPSQIRPLHPPLILDHVICTAASVYLDYSNPNGQLRAIQPRHCCRSLDPVKCSSTQSIHAASLSLSLLEGHTQCLVVALTLATKLGIGASLHSVQLYTVSTVFRRSDSFGKILEHHHLLPQDRQDIHGHPEQPRLS